MQPIKTTLQYKYHTYYFAYLLEIQRNPGSLVGDVAKRSRTHAKPNSSRIAAVEPSNAIILFVRASILVMADLVGLPGP